MGEDHEKIQNEKMGDVEKLSDVEAHKLSRMGEPEDEKRETEKLSDVEAHRFSRMGEPTEDEKRESDDDPDVEGHAMRPNIT